MVLKQIKCPPKGTSKYGLTKFVNTWIPSMESYMIDYIGLGELTGTTSNKEAKKATIGYNKFVKLGDQKCGKKSDLACIGEDKYMYLKTYPYGFIPTCTNDNGNYKHNGKVDIFGKTGLMGSLQEDLYNLNISDAMNSMFNKGPFSSNECMKSRLPVGDSLLMGNSRKFANKEEVDMNGRGWYVEEKCIPRQPTIVKKYGNESFKIPFSASKCVSEEFIVSNNNNKEKNLVNLLLIISILFVFGTIMSKP